VVDNLSENTIGFSPFVYCINNPIAFIDPDGNDWFYYRKKGEDEPSWNWHKGSEYKTNTRDANGNRIVLKGTEAVVVFRGYTKEVLGSKTDHVAGSNNKSNQYLDNSGSISAKVTVYGPGGAKDIKEYQGYTNSSDPVAFGELADGIYDGQYVNPGKGGSLSSNWYLPGNLPARFGKNPAYPQRKPGFINGVYIHSHNNDGWAGTWTQNGNYKGVTQGCLLIARSQWNDFNNQMNGVQNFKVQIRRELHPLTYQKILKIAFPSIRLTSNE
jgi:hypothetical protein